MSDVFIDSDGHVIRNSMIDEHSIVKIAEKKPDAKNIGKIICGETNSNILTFEINRYYDNVDLMTKEIKFIIETPSFTFDDYASNVQHNTNILRFSWVVPYAATQESGKVNVAIEFFDNNYSMKTLPFVINVDKSLSSSVESVEAPVNWYIDIEARVLQLENRVSEDIATAIAEYLTENPIEAVSDEHITEVATASFGSDDFNTAVETYSSGVYVKNDEFDSKVNDYLAENGFADVPSDVEQLSSKIDDIVGNSNKITEKYALGGVDLTAVTIGEVTNSATLSTFYPVLVDDTPNGEISDLYRYSVPVKVASEVFPLYKAVTSGDARQRAFCVEFYVDDAFEVKVYTSSQMAVVIDGVQATDNLTIVSPTDASGCYVLVQPTTSGKHHVALYMLGSSRLFGIYSNGTISKYEANRMRLVTDGDSIVEGSAVIGNALGAYACWASRVAQMLDMDLLNVGIGGSGYLMTGNGSRPNMVDRFADYIAPYQPDMLIVSAGLNDCGEDIDTVKTQIDAYWAKVAKLSPKYVIAVSPFSPQPTSSVNEGVKAIADYLRKVAVNYGYPYIDIVNGYTYDGMGNIISQNPNQCIITESNQEIFYEEYYAGTVTDRTHPNASGHKYIGQYIGNEIFKLCKDGYGLV